MKHTILCLALSLITFNAALAQNQSMQITTTSWHGLSGLFVAPTARLIGKDRFAMGFNESKHTEFINNGKYTDRQVRGVMTLGITNYLELSGDYMNDLLTTATAPNLSNEDFTSMDIKVRLLKESKKHWYPEVSLGVRDIGDQTADVGPLKNVHCGRKVFLLMSKKVVRDPKTGQFVDLDLGISFDHNVTAGDLGAEVTLSRDMSLIAEGIWDSPFIDFRGFPNNNEPGRFIFDTGLRIYPYIAPGLVLDVGVVGDSEFEFSFGASYVFHL